MDQFKVRGMNTLSDEEMMQVDGGWIVVAAFATAFVVGWAVQTYIDNKNDKKVEKQIQDAIQNYSVTQSVYGR